MKLNRLETHDRLLHFKKDQALNIAQGAEDCLKKADLSLRLQEKSPYIYIFAHPRTHDDGVTKRMVWQARLTKPFPQVNSYCFRAQSKSDLMEVCWLLPPVEMWPQYTKGNVTENELVLWSIDQFKNNRENLERAAHDDLPDAVAKSIYRSVIHEMKQDNLMKRNYSTPAT